MAKLKTERHHWWPECLSQYWADSNGGTHWLLPDGSVRRSTPNNFGVIKNGHAIKLGADPSTPDPWDETFESEFQIPDSNFPSLVDWLRTLDCSDPDFDQPIAARIQPQSLSDAKFSALIQCLVSLAARSPMYRQKAVSLAEYYRGPLPERERNQLIGLNIRHAYRNAVQSIGGRGKAMVILSPEKEFIFGDGFYNNRRLCT